MELRYYQQEAVESIYQYFMAQEGNPIVAMPTGTGKSVVIAAFIKGIYKHYPNQRLMMLTHVKELIEQNFEKMTTLWPTAPAGIYSAGIGRKEAHQAITFAGIGSVAKKAELFGHQDLILIDECHLVNPRSSTMYSSFLEELKKINPRLKVIGLTATKYRLGLGLLTNDGIFTDVCYDITGVKAFARLIAEGYLAPLIPRRTSTNLDLDKVKTSGGEFVQKDLQNAIDVDAITYAAVQEIIELGHDRRSWLIFATGVEHAIHISDMLCSLGIEAVAIHSKLTKQEREDALAGFKSGRYRAAVNNNVLTTGFDHPPIDLIGMLRPTKSPGLWVQMLGRGTRPCEGKENCLVLDFAGNTKRLGPIDDPVLPQRKGEGSGGMAPVRLCEGCGTYNHASARVCINCGFEFPRHVKIQHHASDQELLTTTLPQMEDFKVDRVIYAEHKKRGRPSSLKVTYYCGLRLFHEYICFEHQGFAKRKAHGWWRERHLQEPPETIAEALEQTNSIKTPKSISVWVNKKYPEILSYEYES